MDAVQVLRKVEWCKSYSYCTGWPCCPICGGIKPGHGRDENGTLPDNQGHRAGCDLAAAINAHNPQLSGGVAVRLSARLGVTSEDDNMDNPQERAKRLATNAAEEFVRCNGIPTGAPDQFVFHGADLADEYFQDCLAHLKWAGECVVFEHDEETTVILGDYTLGSFE